MQIERDDVSGQNTTGHEWDGIKELDTPVPRPAVWAYVITTIIAVSGWVLYPSVPLGSNFFHGVLGITSRANVLQSVEVADATKAKIGQVLLDGDLNDLVENEDIRARFEAPAKVLFKDNCAACHGRDLQGQIGFPRLSDASWLFGDDLDEIETTIRHGINAKDDETRFNQMPAFGRDGLLEPLDIENVSDYVLSLSGRTHDEVKASAGAEVFANECSGCHGDDAKGIGIGAPNLTDNFWIYGGARKDILATLENGRAGHMPNWQNRLSDAEIRQLVLYLKWSAVDGQEGS